MSILEGGAVSLLPRLLTGSAVFIGCALFILLIAFLGCLLLCRRKKY